MGIAYNPKTVTEGLVLCLDAANPKSYPGTGSTWTDLSGNGNNGTLVNSPGISQQYFSFNGSGKRATITPVSIVTVSVWYARTDAESATNWRSIFAHLTLNLHHLILQQSTYILGIWDGGFKSFGYTPPNDSIFRNYVVTYNNGLNASLYVNGEFISTVSTTMNLNTNPIGSIGNWASGTYWAGRLNLPTFYNRALSAAEIQQNFNAARGRYGI
jgi:hypothetical protein